MRRLTSFTIVSLNGCYKDENSSLDWHQHGAEELEISRENLRRDGTTLLLGRKTYEEFASFWATEQAFDALPEIAQRMADAEKVIFSRNLSSVGWANSRLAQNNLIGEVKQLKAGSGGGMTLLGSGEIFRQLAKQNLIDDYLLLVDPIILAKGVSLFGDIKQTFPLKLHVTRQLASGALLLHYQVQLQ